MVTLKDVAKLAGVSVATVSYVLRGTKTVGADVEARVRRAARELRYQPNRSAQMLRTGRSHTVGLLVPDLTNPYFPALVQALLTSARNLGYATIMFDSQNDPSEEGHGFTLLSSYRVDGVIWIPVTGGDIPNTPPSMPVVVVDRPVAGFDVVYADHASGGEQLAQYAASLGHCRIGLLSGHPALSSAAKRRAGFVKGAAAAGLKIVWEEEVPFSSDLPQRARELLGLNSVTLVACANDTVAAGVLAHLAELGITVPSQVSVLGFDDMPWAELLNPPLSTVRQPVAEIGRQAAQLLHDRILDPDGPLRREVLPVSLIARGSVLTTMGGYP